MTLAPDPHASVAVGAEAGRRPPRRNVGRVDEVEHLVFRIRLLHDLQQQAAQLVVFRRFPALEANLRDLLGVDVARERARVTVVPEGIDPVPLDRAARQVPAAARGGVCVGLDPRRPSTSSTTCSARCPRIGEVCPWPSLSAACTG